MGVKRTLSRWGTNWVAGNVVRNNMPQIATRGADQFVGKAIDGISGFPGARDVARKALQRTHDVDDAVTAVIEQHVRLAGLQGFVTNLGGVVTMPVAIPANLAGIAMVQLRMSAAIAHLRGYDVADPRVRSAAVTTLLGERNVTQARRQGSLSYTPHRLITSGGEIPAHTADQVSAAVISDLVGRVTGKYATLSIARRVPVLGGAVSAGVDALSTHSVGRYADREFPPRLMVEQA